MNTSLLLAFLALVFAVPLVMGEPKMIDGNEVIQMLCVEKYCGDEISYAVIKANYQATNKPAHLQLKAGDHVAVYGKLITPPYDKFWEGLVIDPKTRERKSERGVFPKSIARELSIISDHDKLLPVDLYANAYFGTTDGPEKPEIIAEPMPDLTEDFMASKEDMEEYISNRTDEHTVKEEEPKSEEGDSPEDIRQTETIKEHSSNQIEPTPVTSGSPSANSGGGLFSWFNSEDTDEEVKADETVPTTPSPDEQALPDSNITPKPTSPETDKPTETKEPADSENTPPGEEAAPTNSKDITPGEEVTLTDSDSLPTESDAPLTDSEAPLTDSDFLPTEAPPTDSEAPPTDSEAPPTHSEPPPTHSETPPIDSEALSTDLDAPASGGEDTPTDDKPAESEAQPAETDAVENLAEANRTVAGEESVKPVEEETESSIDERVQVENEPPEEHENTTPEENQESITPEPENEQEETTQSPEVIDDPYNPKPPTGDEDLVSEFTTVPPSHNDNGGGFDSLPDTTEDLENRVDEELDEGYESNDDEEQDETTPGNAESEIPNVTPQPEVQEEDNSSAQPQDVPAVPRTDRPVITGSAGQLISYNYPLIQAQLEPGFELHMWIIAESLPPAIQEVLVTEPFGLPPPIWIEVALIAACLAVSLGLYTAVTCVCVTFSNLSHNSKLKGHLSELNSKLEAAQAELLTNTSDSTEQKELVERAKLEIEQIKESKDLLELQMNDLNSAFDKLESSKAELQTDLEQKSEEIESARILIAQWNEYGTNMENAKTEWADEKTQLSALIEQQTKTHQQLIDEFSQSKETAQRQIQTLQDSVTVKSGLSSENALKYEEEIASLESSIKSLQDEKSKLTSQLDDTNTRLSSIEADLDSARTVLTSLQESCDNKDEELSLLKSCVQTISGTTDDDDDGDTENKSNLLKDMMETAKVMQELESVKEKLESTETELEQEKTSKKLVEGELATVKYGGELLSAERDQLVTDSTAAKQNLSYMTELYEKANKTIARLNAAKESDSADASIDEYKKQIVELKQEVTSWRQRHEDKEAEYKSSEKDLRKRTMDSEKKAHDSWMVLRDTERKVTALKSESQALKEANLAFERENFDLNETNKSLLIEMEIERSRQHRLDDRSDSASIESRRRRPDRPASRNSITSSRYGGLRDNNSMSPYDKREKENEPVDPLRAPPPMHAYSKTGKKKDKKKQSQPAESYSPYSQDPYPEADNGSAYGIQPHVLPGAYMNPGAMPDQMMMDPNMMPPGMMPGMLPPGQMVPGMMMDPNMMSQGGMTMDVNMMPQGGMMHPNMMANMSAIPQDGSMNWSQNSGLHPNLISNIPPQNQQTGYQNHPQA